MTIENSVIIFICVAYQFADHSWRLTERVAVGITAVSLLFSICCHEESAQFYYNIKNYDAARKVLDNISKFNGVAP